MTTPDDPNAAGPWESPQQNPPPPYDAPAPPPYGAPPPQYGAPPPPYGSPTPPGWNPSPYGAGGFTPSSGYASWGERVAGRLIDFLVALPAVIIVIIGLAVGGGGGALLVVIGYLAALGIAIWNEFIRQGRTGQTIGKQQMNIKLIRESDGQVLGGGFCFVRSLAHVVDSLACYIGWLWPLWDDRKQTFADKICGTVVVKT